MVTLDVSGVVVVVVVIVTGVAGSIVILAPSVVQPEQASVVRVPVLPVGIVTNAPGANTSDAAFIVTLPLVAATPDVPSSETPLTASIATEAPVTVAPVSVMLVGSMSSTPPLVRLALMLISAGDPSLREPA